jgi:hypothetical protein
MRTGIVERFLENLNLERLFLGHLKPDIRMNLSNSVNARGVDLKSVIGSVEAKDRLILSDSVSVLRVKISKSAERHAISVFGWEQLLFE